MHWCPLQGFAIPLLAQQLSRRSSVCVLCNDLFLGMCTLVPLTRVCYTLIGSTAEQTRTAASVCLAMFYFWCVSACTHWCHLHGVCIPYQSMRQYVWLNSRADAAATVCFVMFITVVSVHACTGAACKCSTVGHFPSPVARSAPACASNSASNDRQHACMFVVEV